MADATLSTTVSRRSMLAGGAAAIALPAVATLPGAAGPRPYLPTQDPNARLFRRIAVAVRLRKEYARACRLRGRLLEAMAKHPAPLGLPTPAHVKWYEIAEATGDYPSRMRWFGMHRRYAAAVRGAVAVPAHATRGVHAKLALALVAARRGDARIYLYEAHDYVEATLADLRRIAAREEQTQGRPA